MENVFLRGRSDGYELEIPAERNFDDSMVELNNLLQKVRSEDSSDHEINFRIRTGRRILTTTQHQRLVDLFTRFDHFEIVEVTSEVVDQQTVAAMLKAKQVHFVVQTVRSGQELYFDGDVVLLGSVHQGATLTASKNIYLVGAANGIIHAGYPDNNEAIIAGDLGTADQLRISDLVEIVADNTEVGPQQFAYINDLHNLSIAKLSTLKQEKPKLYQQLEEQ